jgi:uncharacterized membrane protein
MPKIKGEVTTKMFELMIGVVLAIFLLVNFFVPTINTATNNTDTLNIMGSDYGWILSLIVILVLVSIAILIYNEVKA